MERSRYTARADIRVTVFSIRSLSHCPREACAPKGASFRCQEDEDSSRTERSCKPTVSKFEAVSQALSKFLRGIQDQAHKDILFTLNKALMRPMGSSTFAHLRPEGAIPRSAISRSYLAPQPFLLDRGVLRQDRHRSLSMQRRRLFLFSVAVDLVHLQATGGNFKH